MALSIFSGGRELCCWSFETLDLPGNLLKTTIIQINEAELIKKTAQGAIADTMKPPTMGPTTRPKLLARALRVRASGNSLFETSPLIVGIMGVLIKVVPAPSAKVNSSNVVMVVRPTNVMSPNAADIANMYADVIRRIFLLSKISDNIPEGSANNKIGRALAVVMRETNKGFGASDVISHDAPTSYIAAPTYENRAAIHNVLYRLDLRGLRPDTEISFCLSSRFSFPTTTIN
jgi:hypothetical protein